MPGVPYLERNDARHTRVWLESVASLAGWGIGGDISALWDSFAPPNALDVGSLAAHRRLSRAFQLGSAESEKFRQKHDFLRPSQVPRSCCKRRSKWTRRGKQKHVIPMAGGLSDPMHMNF